MGSKFVATNCSLYCRYCLETAYNTLHCLQEYLHKYCFPIYPLSRPLIPVLRKAETRRDRYLTYQVDQIKRHQRVFSILTSCRREAATICPALCDLELTFDLLTLEVVSESRVTWATSVPILVFLDLVPMYATDRRQTSVRQTDVRQHHCLMPPPKGGA